MTKQNFSVAVLLSAGRHPVSGTPRPCRGDAVALGLGRRLVGEGVSAIHAGEADEPALQDYLALGAGRIEALTVRPEHDILAPLAARLKDVDLIITGSRTELGAGSGLLPYALAGALGRPIIPNVLEAQLDSGEVRIRQFLPKGKRRKIAAPLPVILAIHALAPVELRYAYARRVAGQIAAVHAVSSPESAESVPWSAEQVKRRPIRLKAEDKKSAHARLLSAIVSESKGGVVAIEGSCVDKAQIMLTYLRENRLVDF
jgi:N,N-dimethylglycine/sarcosine catabolism electron transfer flavoprotein subunit beta